jgi:hypothetical protein
MNKINRMKDIWKVGLVRKISAADRTREECEMRRDEEKEQSRVEEAALTGNRDPELADEHIDHPVRLPWLEVVVQLVILLPHIIRQRVRGSSVSGFHRSQQLIFFDQIRVFPEDVSHVAGITDAIHNQRQQGPGNELHLRVASLVPASAISSATIR